MLSLHFFDQALADHSHTDRDAWSDDGIVVIGQIAAGLDAKALIGVRAVWPDRPPLWQKHCAEALSFSDLDPAIDILLDMVDRGRPDVAFEALGSLREFATGGFTPAQTAQTLAALETRLHQPIGRLQRVVLEAFLATLRTGRVESS